MEMEGMHNLPDHILLEIFGNLSPKMIKTCSLVCKRWDEIISNSAKMMGKFQLNLNKDKKFAIQATGLKRKHHTAIDRHLREYSLDIMSGHNLQTLKIVSSDRKLSVLIKLLNNLPLLKVFDASYVYFTDDISQKPNFKKIQLNLKELRCAVELISIFDCCTIEVLELLWTEEVDNNGRMLVIDFLKQQKNLQELDLSGECSEEFFTMPEIYELNWSLQKFNYFYQDEYFPFYENFIRFLQLHKNTLTSLEMKFFTKSEIELELTQKFVLENLSNLKHLNLGYAHVDLGDEYKISFEHVECATDATRNIESLAFNFFSYDLNHSKRLFEMFPNIKRLIFEPEDVADDNDVQLLFHISKTNNKLEALNVSHLDIEDLRIINFPNVKEFSVIHWTEGVLCSFIHRHSKTLEKIHVHNAEHITHLVAKEILNCDNLKYVELVTIGKNVSFMRAFREISSNIKRFTLRISYDEIESKMFQFPDDITFWNEEIEALTVKI